MLALAAPFSDSKCSQRMVFLAEKNAYPTFYLYAVKSLK